MKIKRIINEIRKDPRVVFYYFQGHLRWFLHGRAIKQYWTKKKECPTCFEKNQCLVCSCPFNQIALSAKTCDQKKKQGKLLELMTQEVSLDDKT